MNGIFTLFFLGICQVLLANAGKNQHVGRPNILTNQPPSPYVQFNALPPRLEWDQNYGYCGEVSFIIAGLYYGQYCSQFTARSLTSPGVPQYAVGSQLLLGINDQSAAVAMALDATEYDTSSESSTTEFLAWVKSQVIAGYPVVIGIFNSEYLLYGISDPDAGDPNYDHIVTVYGVGSNHPLSDMSYHDSDVVYFHDNGLWGAFRNPPYKFSYPFGPFQTNRQQANAFTAPPYSLNNDAINFGIVFTGVLDPGGDTIPVRCSASINYEIPEIVQGARLINPPPQSNEPPPPIPLTLTATVSIPDQSVSYNLYLYNDFSLVPTTNFNAQAGNAVQIWNIPPNSGSTYTVSLAILSSDTAVFRAVPASAP